MTISTEKKAALISEYRIHENDTGSSHVQCSILTTKINILVEHLKLHKHDHSSRRGLLKMVNKRRKLLNYLKGQSVEAYQTLRLKLNLRDLAK